MATKKQSFCSDCLEIKSCKSMPTDFDLINCTDKMTKEMQAALEAVAQESEEDAEEE